MKWGLFILSKKRRNREKVFCCGRLFWLTCFGESLQGFQYHVKNDHNMWAYLFFFIHLRSIKETDYTTLELYIHKQVNYWFIVYFKTSSS